MVPQQRGRNLREGIVKYNNNLIEPEASWDITPDETVDLLKMYLLKISSFQVSRNLLIFSVLR